MLLPLALRLALRAAGLCAALAEAALGAGVAVGEVFIEGMGWLRPKVCVCGDRIAGATHEIYW